MHLGDIIDGNDTPAGSMKDFDQVVSAFSRLRAPVSHALGNHCLEISREDLQRKLNLPKDVPAAYQALDLTPTWRMLLVDTMACSTHGPATPQLRELAQKHLEECPDAPNSTDYNGGLGEEQIAWLRAELERARQDDINVIVAGHHPFAEAVAPPALLVWHADKLMEIISEFKTTVRAVFSGHFHFGGAAEVEGVHHVVFESILDSTSEQGSYGTVSLHSDRIEISGNGDMTSRILKF